MTAAISARPGESGIGHPTHRLSCRALVAMCALFCASAMAAEGNASTDLDARYRAEREACDSNPAVQDRDACRRDAAAARDAAKQGQLSDEQRAYRQNALTRCEALPEEERDYCRRRARDEGETRGSVEGGGILREYREFTLPSTKPQESGEPAR